MNFSRLVLVCAISVALFALAACAPAAVPTAAPPTSAPPAPTAAPTTAPAPVVPTAPSAATVAPTTASSAASDPTLMLKLARVANFGLFVSDGADRTLYAFDNDKKDTSTCTGNCLQNWPPFIVKAVPQAEPVQSGIGVNQALISTFMRADGTMQAEYDGRPLYYYSGDKAPGDFKGHNIGNLWHVLSPRGSPMLNPVPPTPTKAP